MVVDLIDDLFEGNCNNFDKVRGCFLVLSAYYFRTSSIFSSDEEYAMRVQKESNRIVEDESVAPSDSPQLEYTTSKSQNN